MHLSRAILVAFSAIIVSCVADELVHKTGPMSATTGGPVARTQPQQPYGQHQHQQQPQQQRQGQVPPGPAPPARAPERQSRGFDFLAPFRGLFGGRRPSSQNGGGPAGPAPAASNQHHQGKHYGVKPTENNGKPQQQPQQGQYYGGPQYHHQQQQHQPHGQQQQHQPQQQQPHSDFMQDGYRPGFPPSFGEYSPFGDDFGQQGGFQGASSSHGSTHQGPPPPQPYSQPPPPPPHGKPSFGKRPPPAHGPPQTPPPHHGGPQGGPPPKSGGPFGFKPRGPPIGSPSQQFTYHTYAKPVMKHHHYHSFMNPEGQRFQPQQGFHQGEPKPGFPEGPQPAQQHQVPSFAQPSPSFGSQPEGNNGGFAPNGFQDFAGFGGGPANVQAQGSQSNPADFFGGPESYPEQYEDQTRNTREPQIITADSYEGTPQGPPFPPPPPPQGFGSEYFPSSTNSPDDNGIMPSSSPRPFFPPEPSSTPSAFHAQASSGPIIKSHPLRSRGHGRPTGPPGPPPPPSAHPGSYDEESRPESFLYRPVSSSIQVPGAVDEDAVYGKPMMMDASTVSPKPIRTKKMKSGGQQTQSSSKQRPVFMPYSESRPTHRPFKRPIEEIMPLESPQDPNFVRSSSATVPIVDSESAATGHHHGHGNHGGESSNGDRILYHVAGHEGPYSYRFGYDTGKGYNRMFRFEEKDGKGYVTGKYGFYDKHGKLNVVKYEAHPEHGYKAERDHGHHHQSHHIQH